MGKQAELMKGTLDLLVLKTLALEPRHGVGVADRIRQVSGVSFDGAVPGPEVRLSNDHPAAGSVERSIGTSS